MSAFISKILIEIINLAFPLLINIVSTIDSIIFSIISPLVKNALLVLDTIISSIADIFYLLKKKKLLSNVKKKQLDFVVLYIVEFKKDNYIHIYMHNYILYI